MLYNGLSQLFHPNLNTNSNRKVNNNKMLFLWTDSYSKFTTFTERWRVCFLWLFTNIPSKDTLDYIIHKFYNEKSLKLICKKLIFKRLLFKLTTVRSNLIKVLQANRWLRNVWSFISNIGWRTYGKNCGWRSKINKRSILSMICWQHIQQNEQVWRAYIIWNFHFDLNIKFTINVNPEKFLGTKIILNNKT